MHIQESYRLIEGIADTSCNISIKVKLINEYFNKLFERFHLKPKRPLA